ncbi:HAD-IIB family hydrolase [Hydrogenimonas thermophila]|uniref:HAD-IIB family hydrolase n=1 Tax=Hydrogenimonas thermophila TaxID=223786 RepID=UPI002936E5EF|nr:HAD-IIB family hydrolase [Hydrogenimonas thermophila]WOE69292.1 HAD-IIB family hydrolase [Hydrogenimonas thermophila]WOE71802.1 HAD-IIB family hydrolase [Hydrogenimonas thermophila]
MQNFYLTDLDKTFLRTDLSVSDFSRNVFNIAVSNGVKLSVATARSYTGVCKLLKGLHLKEPLIVLDGVMITSADGDIIHVSALERDIGDEIIEIGKQQADIFPLLVGLDSNGVERFIYPKQRNRYQEELLRTYHNDRRLLDADPLKAMEKNLKIVYMESEKVTAQIELALKEKFKDEIEIKRSKDSYMDCWFMTVMHAKGDKAHALKKLEEIEGVNREHTTVFGDSHNDLGLFNAAGRKIAVANAIDELKAVADIVLPWTNDEDAVARFLKDELHIKS